MFFNYSICIFFSFFMFFLSFSCLVLGLWFIYMNKVFFLEWSMLSINKCDIIFPLVLDSYGLLFSSLVLYISGNIFVFSSYYMEGEAHISRFMNLVVLFVISMNFLIYIPHLMGLLLGWDGLGIVSFLLVIYYQNPKSLAAGVLTALSNRIGDVFILLSVGWCINQGYWLIMYMDSSNLYSGYIIFSIMLASMTKSAQIPFSSWLPAAMAAPTPVSALVHSSTLVTAGVFLMVRFYPFLSMQYMFNNLILVISCMTMFMSGISAIFECDMKKVVALSTLSQLGVMMSALGLGFPALAFFHLLTHALFKALLFVCVGSLIHMHMHSQDLRFMGNLCGQLPLTMCCMNIANMALCGLPFLSGFYSKDLLIELSLFNNYSFIIMFLFLFSTMLTSCYSVRLSMTGVTSMNMSIPMNSNSDNSYNNTYPMIMLCLGAVLGGCLINWLIIYPFEDPCIPTYFKLLALVLTLLGGYLSYMLIMSHFSASMIVLFLCRMNSFMWFMVPLSTQVYIKYPMTLGVYSLMLMDQGWLEVLGPQGVFSSLFSGFKGYESLYNIMFSSFLYFISSVFISFTAIIMSFLFML